jgi:undecaprenyl-diphosphatase
MEWLEVILLGIIEGITEFLPISSTGHLIVAAEFIELQDSLRGTFEIFIQFGAVVAVLLYYSATFVRHARLITKDTEIQQLWLSILVAFLPAATLGFLFGDTIERLLFNPVVVAVAMIIGGIAFIVLERRYEKHKATINVSNTISFRQAIIIGTWQILALIPGTSRSGMSILGGLFAGVSRQMATTFSFYLAIPTLGGATLYTLFKDLDKINGDDIWYLLIGALVAGVVAWLSISWLLRFVASNTFIPFGIYRIVMGSFILLLVATGTL